MPICPIQAKYDEQIKIVGSSTAMRSSKSCTWPSLPASAAWKSSVETISSKAARAIGSVNSCASIQSTTPKPVPQHKELQSLAAPSSPRGKGRWASVFHGWKAAGIVGIAEASLHKPIALGNDCERYPRQRRRRRGAVDGKDDERTQERDRGLRGLGADAGRVRNERRRPAELPRCSLTAFEQAPVSQPPGRDEPRSK